MRHIYKRSQPSWYRDFKKGKTDLSWDDFSSKHSQEKAELKCELLKEQHYLCGYCGKGVSDADSHIEHVIPQSLLKKKKFPNITPFTYSNLLISCQAIRHVDGEDTCGHAKGDWYDKNAFISPHDSDCATYFRFTHLGEMIPSSADIHSTEHYKAEKTMKELQLNTYALNRARKDVISAVVGDELEEELTVDEVRALIHVYQTPDTDGKLKPYCFVALRTLESKRSELHNV